MVREIETSMQQDVNTLSWMSDATKKQAIVKLHAVANKIGYPDRWRDYSRLAIVRGDALGNSERANTFEFHRQMNRIGKPLDKAEWEMTPPTVNAYYNPLQNNINFPAGILQPPFYNAKADPAVNYGASGGVIGHELTHGFDDEGRQFDAQGNLKDWWTEGDAKAFEERAQCFIDEYSAFTAVDDVKVNGKLTLGENAADVLHRVADTRDTQDGRQLHARAALLRRVRPELVRERASGTRAHAGADQSARAAPAPGERRRLEHAGIRQGVLLQGRRADGPQERVPRLVETLNAKAATAATKQLVAVQEAIVDCNRCSRLRRYCREIARTKRRAYRDDDYWGKPVPGFGDPRARLLIVGLAPAAHGANRTGRVFTGDGVGGSGDFLMSALHHSGFANIPTSQHPDDGLALRDAYIAAAVRCAPPDNKPTREEISECLAHLDDELSALRRVRIVVALGRIAFDAYLQLLKRRQIVMRPRPVFGHGIAHALPNGQTLIGSYHPSRQNTNTGTLTPRMMDEVFRAAARRLHALT